MRVIGTLYNRKMFIYWLHSTEDDPRIVDFWKRTLMDVQTLNWDVMGPEWQEAKKRAMGVAAEAQTYRAMPSKAKATTRTPMTRRKSSGSSACPAWTS